jgi:hypothetical protein
MTITKHEAIDDKEAGHSYQETTLDGQAIKQLVTRYPEGDQLDVQASADGEVILTLVPAFQADGDFPQYGNLAPLLAPLHITHQSVSGATRTIELSPGENRIQRFQFMRAIIPASANLEVETGYSGNPFSVRLRAN